MSWREEKGRSARAMRLGSDPPVDRLLSSLSLPGQGVAVARGAGWQHRVATQGGNTEREVHNADKRGVDMQRGGVFGLVGR
jgi:hypothetical protein